jgi:hypothetical protein
MRVPLYDKGRGLEEIAVCSLDFLVSGHRLEKNSSAAGDKSKSKVDLNNETEDAIFSQMSYTVESDKEIES